MGLEDWHTWSPGLKVMAQGPPAFMAASLGWILPALQGPPCPLPPSHSPSWAQGGKGLVCKEWQETRHLLPSVGVHAMSSEPARGWKNWHQCARQALGPLREALPGQSTARERGTSGEGLGELLESFDTFPLPQA